MMATGSVDSFVGIWLLSSNPIVGKDSIIFLSYLEKHVGGVNVVRFSPCGNLLATGGDDGNLIIWEINKSITFNVDQVDSMTNSDDICTFKCVLRGHIDAIYDICWSNDSTMICSGSIDSNCILWSVENRKYVHIFSDNKSYVQGLAWSPCPIHFKNNNLTEAILCHCADGTAKMYSVATRKVAKRIPRYIDASSLQRNNNNLEDEGNETKKPSNFQIYSDDLHGSFYRRCAYSPDGLFFILTSGVITKNFKSIIAPADNNSRSTKPIRVAFLYSTLLPSTPLTYYVASDRASCIAVKFSPKVYKLREHVSPKNINPFTQHYRMLFAILSMDSLVILDTQSLTPIGYVKNTHLSAHTDVSWFPDGNGLVFTSTDGYCTICEFSPAEIGTEIVLPIVDINDESVDDNESIKDVSFNVVEDMCLLGSAGATEIIQEGQPLSEKETTVHLFKTDNINVKISNRSPEDIKSQQTTNENTPKPKRVPFITLSKPMENR